MPHSVKKLRSANILKVREELHERMLAARIVIPLAFG
jgi:hypothetical protein